MTPTAKISLMLTLVLSGCSTPMSDEDPRLGAQEAPLSVGKPVKEISTLFYYLRDAELAHKYRPKVAIEWPVINSFSPATVSRGQTLTINGSGFGMLRSGGSSYTVEFQADTARVSAAPLSTTSTQIRVVVPATATTGLVRLIGSTGYQWTTSVTALTVTLPAPSVGTIHFTNDSQFTVADLVVNNQPQLFSGNTIPPGASIDITGPGGLVPWYATFLEAVPSWVFLEGNVQFVNGQTRNQSIRRITASDVLTGGSATVRFEGAYWVGIVPHAARLDFAPTGTWQLYADGIWQGSGSYADDAFLPGSTLIGFSLSSGSSSGSTFIDTPYQSFFLDNGPPDWPVIEYSRM
jgi:hypothetical protein